MSASTLRLRVSPGAAAAAVVRSAATGIEPNEIGRRLAMAGGQEQESA